MDKNKSFKLSGLIGLAAAIGYTMYSKVKRTRTEGEIIDISPEKEEIEEQYEQK